MELRALCRPTTTTTHAFVCVLVVCVSGRFFQKECRNL
jgi:hypothetical protein